jgi:hypothetical protein
VHDAGLDIHTKALLWHYAYAYNWSENRPSYYSQELICLLTGMSPSTYQKARKRLLELGWIIEYKRGRRDPVLVTPRVGMDDEKILAKIKAYKSKKASLAETIRSLPDEFFNPFSDEDEAAS